MRQISKNVPVTLNSWKEIADYLHRGVRTVQRWEHELGLPVHRIGKGKRSPVYATSDELNFWLRTSDTWREQNRSSKLLPVQEKNGTPIEDSRRLLSNVLELAKNLADNTARQRKQAEILKARVLQMQKRIK